MLDKVFLIFYNSYYQEKIKTLVGHSQPILKAFSDYIQNRKHH